MSRQSRMTAGSPQAILFPSLRNTQALKIPHFCPRLYQRPRTRWMVSIHPHLQPLNGWPRWRPQHRSLQHSHLLQMFLESCSSNLTNPGEFPQAVNCRETRGLERNHTLPYLAVARPACLYIFHNLQGRTNNNQQHKDALVNPFTLNAPIAISVKFLFAISAPSHSEKSWE